MTEPVLHDTLPFAPWLEDRHWRMPGMQALDPTEWLLVDEAFAGQMALRDQLIKTRTDDDHALLPSCAVAAQECLAAVVETLKEAPGYRIFETSVVRPDGIQVALNYETPLLTLGRLVQEDFCILEPGADGHVLTGAILCFPAGWTLSEKIGKPLSRIHVPVQLYDEGTERRVQRLFDAVQPDKPMWRANALLYNDPDLFAPRREGEGSRDIPTNPKYLRSERQTISRLPKTGAVVFGIHTYVVPIERLTNEQRAGLDRVRARGIE